MPHLTVEYSANLEPGADIPGLLAAVHRAALETGVFEIGGIRVRAERRDLYIVADGAPENRFVAVHVRIGAGRDEATRARMAEHVFAAVTAHLAPVYDAHPLAISLEVSEIAPVGSLKQNNLHARLKERRP